MLLMAGRELARLARRFLPVAGGELARLPRSFLEVARRKLARAVRVAHGSALRHRDGRTDQERGCRRYHFDVHTHSAVPSLTASPRTNAALCDPVPMMICRVALPPTLERSCYMPGKLPRPLRKPSRKPGVLFLEHSPGPQLAGIMWLVLA